MNMTKFGELHTLQPLILMALFVIVGNNNSFGQNILIQPYLQNAQTTSMTIMWEADSMGNGYVDWGNSPFSLIHTTGSTSQVGSGNSRIHTTKINGLSAQNKYYYRIRMNDGQLTNVYHFVTPPTKSSNQPVQLIAISDMQRDNGNPDIFRQVIEEGMIPIIQNELETELSGLEAILIPGDLVAAGGDYPQWKNFFFNPSDSLTPYVPMWPVLGNHEYFSGGFPNFIKYFDLPTNGASGLLEECWFQDLSNIRMIGLNSNSDAADKLTQLQWLENVLQETCEDEDVDFVFAELHHPFKSELWIPGESDFTGDVIQLLEEFSDMCNKPSVHFFGHTHGYSRGQSRDHQHLWVNVATSGGNIDYWGEFANADYEEFVKSQDEYGFVLLEVTAGDEAEMRLRRYSRGDEFSTINNAVTDDLTIRVNEFPPQKPNAIFPDQDTIELNCLVLKGSSFNDPDDIHQATHWQISKGCNFIDSLVVERWRQSENYYNEVDLQAGDDLTDEAFNALTADRAYCWRLRYRDQYLKWSEWSEPNSMYVISSATPLSGNLLNNEGAENGIMNWVGDIESLMSNECNSVPVYQGSYMFAVGGICSNEMNIGLAYQEIDLTSYATQIIQGNVSMNYGGYMRDFSGSDVPEIHVEFYNDANNLLLVAPSVSNPSPTWLNKSSQILIPTTATSVKFILMGIRNAGSDNDSYFDELNANLTIVPACETCFSSTGGAQVDADGDGFCEDLDCNDMDSTSYPGALELCDGIDNNCDGIADANSTVTWTGDGDGIHWSDGDNWDQDFEPLPCQHVVLAQADSIVITSNPYIKSLFIAPSSQLRISTSAQLTMDGNFNNTSVSARVEGQLNNFGKCVIKKSESNGLEIFGTFTNSGKIVINQIQVDVLNVELGGSFINNSILEAGLE
jgi:hypothetical protein